MVLGQTLFTIGVICNNEMGSFPLYICTLKAVIFDFVYSNVMRIDSYLVGIWGGGTGAYEYTNVVKCVIWYMTRAFCLFFSCSREVTCGRDGWIGWRM